MRGLEIIKKFVVVGGWVVVVVVCKPISVLSFCKLNKRCSNKGALIADMLSKAAFNEFYQLFPERKTEPALIPRELLLWIKDPKEDMKLGQRILKEMSQHTLSMGYNC